MKTKDRILVTSLELFNQEGETNVTTVDIALEMDISPGNLYYHFKGKEAIIESLYLTMEHELKDILNAPKSEKIDAENIWFYLYVVFEGIYKYRFFYRNVADILMRYPDIKKRFVRLINKKRETATTTLNILNEYGIADFQPFALPSLAENITLVLTYWMNHIEVTEKTTASPILMIHQGVFQIVSLVAPYLHEDYKNFYEECHLLFKAISEELEES